MPEPHVKVHDSHSDQSSHPTVVAAEVVIVGADVISTCEKTDSDKPNANESESNAVKSSAFEFSIVEVTEDSISSSVLEESTSQSAVKPAIAFSTDLRFRLNPRSARLPSSYSASSTSSLMVKVG